MWITGQIILDLKKFGIHGYVSLRSDQEPAITAILDEVCRSRPGTRTLAERPSANVLAERAIIEETIRIHTLALELRLGTRLLVMHLSSPRLVHRCADVLNKAEVRWMENGLGTCPLAEASW